MARPIFLAAPEAGAGALGLIDKTLVQLEIVTQGRVKPSHVFVPTLQVGDAGVDVEPGAFFEAVLTGLQESRVVVAVLDGAQIDENVAFLAAYAFAAEKPVIAYVTDGRAKRGLAGGAVREWTSDVKDLGRILTRHLTEDATRGGSPADPADASPP